MEWAYGWFLGRTTVGVPVAHTRPRGAGQDGLTPSGANRNQGAESTLMWLIALGADPRARSRRGAVTGSAGAPEPPGAAKVGVARA